MQTNVVGKKLTVPMAISNIFKYKKEHGNVAVPNKEPHKQLRRWIVHAKATSKKIIEQGSVNPKFTLPNLKLLNELGIIQLPPNFKLKETTTSMSEKNKEKKKKTTKEPPKAAKAQGARATVSRVSVAVPKKNITTTRPKAKAPIQPKIKLKRAPKKISSAPRATAKASIEPKKILQTPSMSTHVSSPPTRVSPRLAATASDILQTPSMSTQVASQPTRTSPRLKATASNISHQQGTSFFSVLNNPFSKVELTPAHMLPFSSSLLPAVSGSNVESNPSEFPSPHTRLTFNRIKELAYSQTTANPHPSPATVNRMESAHPKPFCPSPPMPTASPTLLDTKVAAATDLLAVATSHIPLELPFESVGLRTRQRSQSSSEISMEPRTVAAIGDLSSGIKCKRVAPPRKANKGSTKKGATKKGANKKGAKDVVSKK
jgi:hypothetical protein